MPIKSNNITSSCLALYTVLLFLLTIDSCLLLLSVWLFGIFSSYLVIIIISPIPYIYEMNVGGCVLLLCGWTNQLVHSIEVGEKKFRRDLARRKQEQRQSIEEQQPVGVNFYNSILYIPLLACIDITLTNYQVHFNSWSINLLE